MLFAMHRPVTGVVKPKKAPSRESHGHQELSRVKKVITAFFRPKRVAQIVPPMNCSAGDLRSFNTRRINYGAQNSNVVIPRSQRIARLLRSCALTRRDLLFPWIRPWRIGTKAVFRGAPSFALLGPTVLAGRKTREGWEGVTL